ncbi:MAG: ketoacyl-ACP synthase III [Firmicutes bacterium]|nr:ketoacyl-ACP synthase III [Bacillota bacterium]
MSFTILGTGHKLPKRVVTNDELSKIVDTSDEWIVSRSGIKQRHVLSDETLTDISVEAAELALQDAKVKISEIDLIIYGTYCGDTHSPSQACLVAERLGASCPCFDVNAACTGFVYSLDVAAGYFARKKAKKVLVFGGDNLSGHLNWQDRASCVLFGDGVGAVVLGEGDDLITSHLTAIPNSSHIVGNYVGGASPFNQKEQPIPFYRINGQEVYKFAVNAACNDLKFVIKQANLTEKDIAWFLLHQANMRIIDTAIEHFGVSKDRFINCIEKTGNVSAASIPILLDIGNREKKFKKGELIGISAFGGGLTTGAAIIRWNKN